ncbi:MAG TPA: retroviral-like aspartic protease family protein [Rhizomicrobium sp.]|jgi:predicted aspartyl protease
MFNIRVILVGGILSAVAAFSSPVQADDCRLQRIASLDMQQAENGILIPVTIEGTSKLMLIDTGAPLSTMDPKVTGDLHLITERVVQGMMYTSSGRQFTLLARIHDLSIGDMHAGNLKFLVWPERMWSDDKVAGTLGADFLRHYDIELDFASHKLNLFSQDHCEGKVVYWTTGPVAVAPIHVVNSGHIVVPVTLDGHDVDAVFDTGASATVLSLEAAENTFGLKTSTPDLVRADDGKADNPFYRHQFKSLVLDGVNIANPTVYVREDRIQSSELPGATGTKLAAASGGSEEDGATDLILGMRELQKLHIYIAYKEQKLYISAGSPQPAEVSSSTSRAASAH